jgi:hypothetical protein
LQFEATDWARELQEACITFVRDTYETLREVASRAELEEHFGQALVQHLELQVLQRQRTLRSLSIRGHVVEAAPQKTSVTLAVAIPAGEQQLMGIDLSVSGETGEPTAYLQFLCITCSY